MNRNPRAEPRFLAMLPRLRADQRGVIAILAALTLTLLMGFAGLAIDVGYWQSIHRRMQAVADQAAYSAANYATQHAASAAATVAKGISAAAGFIDGQKGVTVTVNNPPASGGYASNNNAWEVIVRQAQPMWLASLFLSSGPTLTGRSVALEDAVNPATACILALNTGASPALQIDNNANLPSPTCGIASNSTSADGLSVGYNATVAGPVNVVGQWSISGAHMTGSPQIENGNPVPDPYSGLTLPTLPACTTQSGSYSVNASPPPLNPGYFCSGLTFANNDTITLSAGTYYVANGLSIGNNATIDATAGVTIVITDNSALTLSNNSVFKIYAPSTSSSTTPYPGMALVDLNTSPQTHTFQNNTTLDIKGALYFPHHKLVFSNNADLNSVGCTQVIADTIEMSENVNIGSNCAGVGITPVAFGGNAKLAE